MRYIIITLILALAVLVFLTARFILSEKPEYEGGPIIEGWAEIPTFPEVVIPSDWSEVPIYPEIEYKDYGDGKG